MRDRWTVDDLAALGLEDWFRYEIVDGGLLVSPWAGGFHEFVSAEVRAALWAAQPADLMVVGPIGVTLGRSYLIPDLAVAPRERVRRGGNVAAADVRLAIEIVSPGSTTVDRVVKPAKYAAAGIPLFWRVETDPVSLTAYRLGAGASVYTEVGTWAADEVARLSEPFAVVIDLAAVAAN